MFASNGEAGPPCGVPARGRVLRPPSRSSIAGAFSSFLIGASVEPSTTRLATVLKSLSCGKQRDDSTFNTFGALEGRRRASGGAARARLPPARRCPVRRRARQSARGRHHARHLRLGAQSSYRDVLAHYGAVALPCRVRDPNRKGEVESGVGHAQRAPLAGMRFEGIDEA